MSADNISCRTCGGTSFTHNGKTAKCDYCGAEYDIAQLYARAAKLEAEQKTLDSLADDISRLRQLADQKEAERQRAIEEEKRRQEEEARQQQEELRKQREEQKAYEKEQQENKDRTIRGCSCSFICVLISAILLPSFLETLNKSNLSNGAAAFIFFSCFIGVCIIPWIFASLKNK